MDIFEAIKSNNLETIQTALANTSDINVTDSSGSSPLHIAALIGDPDVLETLLKQISIRVDALDGNGDAPLHISARQNDFEGVRTLLTFGANPNLANRAGKKAIDFIKDPECKALIAERMIAAQPAKSVQQARINMIEQIEDELPNDNITLKKFSIELLLANQLFQDRCKEVIHQLIEEKHIALHKYRLLENAAGIRDGETSGNFLSQLQYLQSENEQQSATIGYLKIQNRMLETSVTQQEEYYRKNLSDLTDQQTSEMKLMQERAQETEKRFLDYQKALNEEIATLKKDNAELKLGGGAKNATPSALEAQLLTLQQENAGLLNKVKEITAEKIAVVERLKSIEQLKSLHENDISKLRGNTNFLHKMMQDSMAKVLTEARNEADDKDENSGELILIRGENGSKQIKGGTPEKLVERLTDPGIFDSQFQAAFLLTFRSFMDTHSFLGYLSKRFKDSTIEGGGQSPVQLRVCNTLKSWIENYWFDFYDDKLLMEKLADFIEYMRRHSEKLANVVKSSMNRKIEGKDVPVAPVVKKNTQPKPKPILPKGISRRSPSLASPDAQTGVVSNKPDKVANWGGFNFGILRTIDDRWGEDLKLKHFDLEPIEIARQMTLVEYELFTAINPTEFLDQAWMKDDKEKRAPNICNMTKWSNHVTRWIITEIVSIKENIKLRASMIERIIVLAQQLEKLNNFNGVKEVLAGLQSSAVYRLKKTREAVGSKYLKIFDDLVKLTSSDLNFKNLRSKVHAADPPLIPFPGVYQGDLVFLDTCSRSKIENGLVNFLKFQKIAGYILELQVYQQTPYNLESVPEIIDYVRSFHVLNDDDAYKESLICEPRGT